MTLGEAWASGAWHGALAAWVVRESGSVLLSRLPREHRLEPSRLAPTAISYTGLGPPAEAVIAAVRDFLGTDDRLGPPRYLGTFRAEYRYAGDAVVRQLQDAYAVRFDGPLEELSPDPSLVDTVYELPLARALALLEHGTYTPAPGFDSMGRVSNALLVEDDLPEQGRAELLAQLRAMAALADGTVDGSAEEPRA